MLFPGILNGKNLLISPSLLPSPLEGEGCIDRGHGRGQEGKLSKEQQARGHYRHPRNEAVGGQVVLPIFFGGWEKLVQADENHDSGDHSEDNAKSGVVEQTS